MSEGCPHKRIEFCPLYVAAHQAGGFGCIRNGDAGFTCAVKSGDFDYALGVGRLRAVDGRMVAQLEWKEQIEAHGEQRRRNMKTAGVH